MFDYQAGEKYKLTLIMVGVAGIIAGMFFTLLLLPSPDMSQSAHRRKIDARTAKIMSNRDITGRNDGGGGPSADGGPGAAYASGQQAVSANSPQMVDRSTAQQFMQNWLPRVWDLSAQTASTDQEEAIKWMTPEPPAAAGALLPSSICAPG